MNLQSNTGGSQWHCVVSDQCLEFNGITNLSDVELMCLHVTHRRTVWIWMSALFFVLFCFLLYPFIHSPLFYFSWLPNISNGNLLSITLLYFTGQNWSSTGWNDLPRVWTNLKNTGFVLQCAVKAGTASWLFDKAPPETLRTSYNCFNRLMEHPVTSKLISSVRSVECPFNALPHLVQRPTGHLASLANGRRAAWAMRCLDYSKKKK